MPLAPPQKLSFPPPDKRIRPLEARVPAPPPAPKALTPYGEFVAALAAEVSAARILQTMQTLTTYPTRHTHSSHNVAVAKWLRGRFRALGYDDVVFHDFTSGGLTRHNLVCTRPGVSEPAKYLVVCGHYDSRGGVLSDASAPAPGANDNASGTAALLELARLLRAIDSTWSLRFIAFSGEEQGLVGSAAYAAAAATAGVQTELLINLDMVGHPADPASPVIIVERDTGNATAANDAASQAYAAQMVQAAGDYTALNTQLGPIYGSDYMPFEQNGVPCIGAYDGADSAPFYHTGNDTLDKVDAGFCADVARMTLGTILHVAGRRPGAALVFDPDPITRSGNVGLTVTSANLDGWRRAVSLQGLAPPDGAGWHLTGTYAQVVDALAPAHAPPASADGVFVYGRTEAAFEQVMAYHHIDALRRHLDTLGLAPLGPAVSVDAHAGSSHYDPVSHRIALAAGSGAGPDHGEDAGMVLHQLGSAILAMQNPGFSSTDGVGSGFGDLLPALWFDDRHVSAATRGLTAPWAGTGRRYDRAWTFDDPLVSGEAMRGELWASAVHEAYRMLGGDSAWPAARRFGRDLVLRLHLVANAGVPSAGPTAAQLAQQLEAADANLGGWRGLPDGLHRKVLYDVFERRKLAGYPPAAVDVYVDDGRAGGYAWLDNFWSTSEIWVRPAPYSAAQLSNASPADHMEPVVGSPAYLYVRVRNRGAQAAGSGPVTVKAYHCQPGAGLRWPDDWTPMTTASLLLPNVLPGNANTRIAGPFVWTPGVVGHECVLVILECAQDPAVTEGLATGASVEHSRLVPFDNNIAQRNLVPVPAKQGGKRTLTVRNPFERPVELQLAVEARLPDGWELRGLPPDARVELEPFGRHAVTLELARPFGAGDPDPGEIARVEVTALLDGMPAGGMTYHLAGEETFARPTRPTPPGTRGAEEPGAPAGADRLIRLGIPREAVSVEGSVRVRGTVRRPRATTPEPGSQ